MLKYHPSWLRTCPKSLVRDGNRLLGATSLVKIGEVWLSGEIGGGFENSKKPNFIITIRYEIPMFSLVGPFFEEGREGV